ncbi:sugar epimerase [bacterium (Candidatus Gribaldobacteria) CG_4_10_14_0_8_um_filter_33_9]|uniref:Sugar epimerase n=1 Tax=bacterium (Candidatus Gribaldobacteria) CG_4_10_14_0_8_um_filter_33_9 TaxID=2014266 RepID=A0A2M7RNC8_9BACT|nr:MAG: sugar epimerase [bacterium (Candidatus Gribaldobacteria) CG_4_10_14_0_8_um_filter_33_9]
MISLFKGEIAADDRGTVKFVNDFNFVDVKRFYQVENHRKGYIRAWHAHAGEGKYVFVSAGAALIGSVELSPTELEKIRRKLAKTNFYMDEVSSSSIRGDVLCEEIPKVLWIPPYHANGAMTLRENTKIIYFSTATLEESKGDDIRFPYDTWNIWKEDFR